MNVECNRLLVEAILQKRLQMFMKLPADAKETREKVIKESFLIASKLTLVFVKEIPLNTYSEIRSKIRKILYDFWYHVFGTKVKEIESDQESHICFIDSEIGYLKNLTYSNADPLTLRNTKEIFKYFVEGLTKGLLWSFKLPNDIVLQIEDQTLTVRVHLL